MLCGVKHGNRNQPRAMMVQFAATAGLCAMTRLMKLDAVRKNAVFLRLLHTFHTIMGIIANIK
jgi:hypothetical protein